jgi:GNAT superfamily N-acetyltransferase
MEILVRDAIAADIPTLAGLYAAAFSAANPAEPWTPAAAENLLRHQLASTPALCLTAEADGRIIGGFFSGIRPWWNGNHLENGELFVDPAQQQSGAGRALLTEILTRARDQFQAVEWDFLTFRQSGFPRAWYESLGFTESDDVVHMNGSIAAALDRLKKTSDKNPRDAR